MTERHHYKYVVIDSSKENHNAVTAKFNVQVPHGITNASRVCVKSFSMPNTIHNIYGDLGKVRFVEFYRPSGTDWIYQIYQFNLDVGYTETSSVITAIQNKFLNASGTEIIRESDSSNTLKQINPSTGADYADTFTTVTISTDSSTYLNTLTVSSGTQDKAFALLVESQNEHTIWESLGFDKRGIMKESDIGLALLNLGTLPAGVGATPELIESVFSTDPQKMYVRGCKASGSTASRTISATHAGTHENHNGIYIASKALGNDTLVSKAHDDSVMVAHNSDVLQYLNNDVAKYAYLTYHTDVPMWNILTKKDIYNFDIEIRDHKGILYPRNAIADFVLVLMFETLEEIEYNKDEFIAYNQLGYRLGHPTTSGLSR